jgi:hypothetical protein
MNVFPCSVAPDTDHLGIGTYDGAVHIVIREQHAEPAPGTPLSADVTLTDDDAAELAALVRDLADAYADGNGLVYEVAELRVTHWADADGLMFTAGEGTEAHSVTLVEDAARELADALDAAVSELDTADDASDVDAMVALVATLPGRKGVWFTLPALGALLLASAGAASALTAWVVGRA